MTTFFSYFKQHKVPSKATLRVLLTPPLTWYGVVLYGLLIAIVGIAYALLLTINSHFLVATPARGGTFTEGVIGAPRLINPLLATTETDKSLTKLLFAGLVKETRDGTFVPELASSYTVSPDGLTYTFTLDDKLTWSDHKPLTSDDVAFTIEKLADTLINPTGSAYWQTILISTPGPATISFTLPEARTDFLSRLTIGVIPEHVWSSVPDEGIVNAPANLHPVGSGMYVFRHLYTDNGIPTEIELKRNTHYALGDTYIDHYTMKFFANQSTLLDALNAGSVDMTIAAAPATAVQVTNSDMLTTSIKSSHTIGLFRQPNDAVFANRQFTQAIDHAIDKNAIIATVLHGYGISETPSDSTDDIFPVLTSLGYIYTDGVLKKNGAGISFSIAVENEEGTLRAAQLLASEFERLGILVTIKAFDHGAFQDRLQAGDYTFIVAREQDVPRTYEKVLSLYTKAYPFITARSVHIPIPSYLASETDRYVEALDWHVAVDNVWKPFSNRSN